MLGHVVLGEAVLGQLSVTTEAGQLSAGQALGAVTQSATVGTVATLSFAQALGGITQFVNVGVNNWFSQVQFLVGVSQSTSVGVTNPITAVQSLALEQAAVSGVVGGITAGQSLGGVSQSVSIVGAPVVTANQTLGAIQVAGLVSSNHGALGTSVFCEDVLGGGASIYTADLQHARVSVVADTVAAQDLSGLYQFVGLNDAYPPRSRAYIIW